MSHNLKRDCLFSIIWLTIEYCTYFQINRLKLLANSLRYIIVTVPRGLEGDVSTKP